MPAPGHGDQGQGRRRAEISAASWIANLDKLSPRSSGSEDRANAAAGLRHMGLGGWVKSVSASAVGGRPKGA